MLAVPLAVWPGLSDPVNLPKLVLLGAGVIVVATLRIVDGIRHGSWAGLDRLTVPAACFSAGLTLAWAASPDRTYAAWGAEYGRFQGLIPYLLAVALGVLVADGYPGRRERSIQWALGAAALVAGGYAIWQRVADLLPSWLVSAGDPHAISTFGNPNFTGAFLAIALCVLLPAALGPPGRDRTWARRSAVVIAAGLVVTGSQGAWLATIGGAALAWGGATSSGRDRRRFKTGVGVAAAMLCVTVGTVVVATLSDSTALASARSRGLSWITAARAARAEPWLGHGLNAFGDVQSRFRTAEAAADQASRDEVPDDPHSLPLALLVNAGLVGLAGFVATVAWLFVHAARINAISATQAGFLGGIAAYLIQASVSIDELSLRVAFWVCLGGFAGSLARDRDRTNAAEVSGGSRPSS